MGWSRSTNRPKGSRASLTAPPETLRCFAVCHLEIERSWPVDRSGERFRDWFDHIRPDVSQRRDAPIAVASDTLWTSKVREIELPSVGLLEIRKCPSAFCPITTSSKIFYAIDLFKWLPSHNAVQFFFYWAYLIISREGELSWTSKGNSAKFLFIKNRGSHSYIVSFHFMSVDKASLLFCCYYILSLSYHPSPGRPIPAGALAFLLHCVPPLLPRSRPRAFWPLVHQGPWVNSVNEMFREKCDCTPLSSILLLYISSWFSTALLCGC